jgi:uncharacterized protein
MGGLQMTSALRLICLHAAFMSLFGSSLAAAEPGEITLNPPGPREFILDNAELLSPEQKDKLKKLCDKLLTDKATPINIVTIDSMAEYGGAGMRIETFATLLFNQWQLGVAEIDGKAWNTGILLLVSRNDRRARIELGAHWRRDQDALAQKIMNEQIVPHFKEGDYAAGIMAGVESLDKMARGLELPKVPPKPLTTKHYVIGAIAIGLVAFTIFSLIRRGASGWAWLFWGVVFAAIGTILYQMANSRGSGSGGGYSGGSYGGGFSGGGGASGSW